MTYLLDTNACVAFLRGRSNRLVQRLFEKPRSDIAVCSIVTAELYFGAYKSVQPERNLAILKGFLDGIRSLPFDDRCAEAYGQLRSHLTGKGTPIGPNDMLIAAVALSNKTILVTHNSKEFSRIEGLRMEDWESE